MLDPISTSSLGISILNTISGSFKYLIHKIINRPITIKIDNSGNIVGSNKKIVRKFGILSRNSKCLERLKIISIEERKELKEYEDIYRESREREILKNEENIKKGIVLILSIDAKRMYQINFDMKKKYIEIIVNFIKLSMKTSVYSNKNEMISIDCLQKNKLVDLYFTVDIQKDDLILAMRKKVGLTKNPIINEALIVYDLCVHDICNEDWLYNEFYPNMLNGIINHIDDEVEFVKLDIAKLYDTYNWAIGLH